MGTNYYAVPAVDRCEHCGRSDPPERLHIGKSSVGWCFALHVFDEPRIRSLEDWDRFFDTFSGHIEDEYCNRYSWSEMRQIITERKRTRGEEWSPRMMEQNNAVPGPNGLVRHRLDRYCLGHGEGPWDLMPGHFS